MLRYDIVHFENEGTCSIDASDFTVITTLTTYTYISFSNNYVGR